MKLKVEINLEANKRYLEKKEKLFLCNSVVNQENTVDSKSLT